MGSYKDIKAYEKSYQAAREIYFLTKDFPQHEQFGLQSQIRRAATSIALNIAEGSGKNDGDKELARYLKMAKGSCAEIQVLLNFAFDFGYISKENYDANLEKYNEIGKMLSGLLSYLRT